MAVDRPSTGTKPKNTPITPMRRLWLRYLQARGAKVGLAMICAFVLVAFLAPFLAHRLPFYWQDGETGLVTYPLIREFFAPSDTTEPLLEKGLNFLFLFIPLALLAWWAMNRFIPALGKIESRALSLLFGALLSYVLWQALGGMLVAGGGNDWFYAETRIMPEGDDVLDRDSVSRPPAPDSEGRGQARKAVLDFLAGKGYVEAAESDGSAVSWTDNADNDMIASAIRDAIQSGTLIDVAEMTANSRIDPRGINDANIGFGLNRERWNRLVIEYAFPGLLRPFVEFRSAFMVLAAATLLVLLGMTYIFMTGANQFALSPRVFVLLVIAGLLAALFQGTPRNDQTPYRRLAAEGKGRGLFPLLPYGPNEQGFGPRLPPDWAQASPYLDEASVLSWQRLHVGLTAPDNPAAKRAAELGLDIPAADENASPEEKAALVAFLNRIIERDDFYSPSAFSSIPRDMYLAPYIQALGGETGLNQLDQARFNRLLLERSLPTSLSPSPAVRWKKPNHSRGTHWIGTDESGRDVLTRLIHGARVSLSVGFVSVALATAIGLVMGSLAAYYGGWLDIAISRFMEMMMCFPSFFLILAVIAVLDRRSILNIMLIIGLTSWTGVARLIRGEMLKHKKMEYVSASIALGATDARTIFRHILPNAMAPVLVSISFGITGAILTEASLSFIGFGVTPPTPTWGQLLSETRESPLANWWLATFPGLVLFLGVLSYNLVGEALRDALDPRTILKAKK